MKTGTIQKTAHNQEITKKQLEQISAYSRRPLAEEELFVFSIILCDNEIDRDYERFSDQALDDLAPLYLGKTGVFDHVALAENQSARIFDTEVVTDGKNNSLNSPYRFLKAWAYMVRCDKTKDLILEIDAGIKKEVSVGCAVASVVCSVCGNEQKTNPCEHGKGSRYGGVLCHFLLGSPTDAYEWSFVAVPAQKNAGVTKGYGSCSLTTDLEEKISKSSGQISLSKDEVFSLQNHLRQMEQLAKSGQVYRDLLCKESVRYAAAAQPELASSLIEGVLAKLTLSELTEFHQSYKQAAEKRLTPYAQLAAIEPQAHQSDEQFKI